MKPFVEWKSDGWFSCLSYKQCSCMTTCRVSVDVNVAAAAAAAARTRVLSGHHFESH
jgi:hypothetical protein